jgi:beta-glucanase (GH16 family)
MLILKVNVVGISQHASTRVAKKNFKYGTFIVRAKLPKGKGSWPAIWFLPTDIGRVRWPKCGEIDLMETVGQDPEVIHFSLHTETLNHIMKTQRTYFKKISKILEGFHDYKMIWTGLLQFMKILKHPHTFGVVVFIGMEKKHFQI